jgi:hypothetical protein
MNLELWPREIREKQKAVSEKKKRTVLFYSNSISNNPDNNSDNPVRSFEKEIELHGTKYGYGAASATSFSVKVGDEVLFLVTPDKTEGIWNWFAQNLNTGQSGYVWTEHRSRGTVYSRRKGLNKKPTLIGKPGYKKYSLQAIAFIVEDII